MARVLCEHAPFTTLEIVTCVELYDLATSAKVASVAAARQSVTDSRIWSLARHR